MIPLKPEHCAAAYDFLRAFPPFDKWRMPPVEAVVFRVRCLPERAYGEYIAENGVHIITLSSLVISQPSTLLRTLAHEMIHLKQNVDGEETKAEHNASFKRHAARVSRLHGYDPREF